MGGVGGAVDTLDLEVDVMVEFVEETLASSEYDRSDREGQDVDMLGGQRLPDHIASTADGAVVQGNDIEAPPLLRAKY